MANQPDATSRASSEAIGPDLYQSFMVRIWRSDGNWRASIIDPHSDQRRMFATRQQLINYIAEQMDE